MNLNLIACLFFSWLTVIGWLLSCLALVFVLFQYFKIRSLTMLVLARPARAQIPKVLQLTTPPTMSVSSANPLQQWAENIQHLFPLN